MQNILAGIDVGGTYTKIGIVDTGNMQILKEKTIPTEEYYNSTNCLNRIIDSILELCLDIKISIDDLEGIGFGILGPVINNKKIVPVRGFHWEDVVDLEKEINKYIDIPVFAENDVNVISFGEYIIRGKDELKNIVTIAIGTGIGAGIIINGKIYSGKNGTAGEIAHTIINSDGEICECGRRGCLSFCGGEPFKKSFLEELKCIGINEYYGHLISDLTVKDIFDAAKDGEKIAVKYINIFSEYLAKGIININNFFNPDLIVIAGGISLSGKFLLDKIKKKYYKMGALDNWMPKPNVELSVLGNHAGIFGAALMTKYNLDVNQ